MRSLALVCWLAGSVPLLHANDPAFPAFRTQEIDKDLKIGYGVLLVDINGDGKKDIVVADKERIVWYENPTWKRRIILEGQTKPDNVCIAAYDIDGDGKIDLVLGADWKPFNTKNGGTLQWLKQGKKADAPWTLYPIPGDIPTIHRIRFADVYGESKPRLIVTPLMGKDSTKEKNWINGSPVEILDYRIPNDPVTERWTPETINQSLHVVHNFFPIPSLKGKGEDILTASYEGVNLLQAGNSRKWTNLHIGEGNQSNQESNRGSSEVKQGKLKNGKRFIATIEPWHGNEVVVYTEPSDPKKLWDRHVIDAKLKWGHAVWCADLDGDGNDELIIGVRDNHSDKTGEKCGVRIYKTTNENGTEWNRHLVDEGGVAVEDLAAADLDGDGLIDIVAVGRATHNVRIYLNKGKK